MNSAQESLVNFIVTVIELGDQRVMASSNMVLKMMTIDVLNTNKFGKVMHCDWEYWQGVITRYSKQ